MRLWQRPLKVHTFCRIAGGRGAYFIQSSHNEQSKCNYTFVNSKLVLARARQALPKDRKGGLFTEVHECASHHREGS